MTKLFAFFPSYFSLHCTDHTFDYPAFVVILEYPKEIRAGTSTFLLKGIQLFPKDMRIRYYDTWKEHTEGENIIATTKIQNNYVALQSVIFFYIAIAILDLSLLLLVKLSLLILFCIPFHFWYQFFASFLMASFLKLLLFQLSR